MTNQPTEPRWLREGPGEQPEPEVDLTAEVSEAEYQARCWDRFVFRLEAAERDMQRDRADRGLTDRPYYGTMCAFTETLFWARAEAKLWRDTEKKRVA